MRFSTLLLYAFLMVLATAMPAFAAETSRIGPASGWACRLSASASGSA